MGGEDNRAAGPVAGAGNQYLRVQELIQEQHIHTVRVEFSDLHGVSRGKAVAADSFPQVVEHGLQYALPTFALDLAGNVAAGAGTAEEENYCDMTGRPDLSTFTPLPWQPGTARVVADLYLRGDALAVSPRRVLQRVVEEYRRLGLTPVVGSELEFFLLRQEPSGQWRTYADRPSMVYTINPLVDPQGVLERLALYMAQAGIPVPAYNHEFYPGQYEINLPHGPAVQAADLTAFFKQMVKEVASQAGLLATFMAKPLNDNGGSGFHLHVSLAGPEGENLFAAPGEPYGLSPLARHFMGGVLAHAPATLALLAPTINSYKRYQLYSFAPYYVLWGLDNRSTYLRVPPERGPGARVENRAADGGANPYLVAAATLAAGLDGIRRQLEPGEPWEGDAYQNADPAACQVVPRSLEEALRALEGDQVLRETLGEPFVKNFLAVKRLEAQRFRDYVTDWEFREYSFYL